MRLFFRLLPIPLALFLYLVNNLGIWNAWQNAPDGYIPQMMPRANGVAAQVVWFTGFRDQWFLPNYQGPWTSAAVFFNPLKFAVGRLAAFLNWEVESSYILFVILIYIFTTYCFAYSLHTFLDTPRQRIAGVLAAICAMPLAAVWVLPAVLRGRFSRSGLGDFVWWTADGYFHGISGSLSSVFGTGITLLAMSLVARYADSGDRRYLRLAGVAAFFSGIVHPFEVFVITIGGSVALALRDGAAQAPRQWRRAFAETLLLAGPGALAVSWYVVQALRSEWLRDQASVLKWDPGSPLRVLAMLGLPAILSIVLMALQPRFVNFRERLLGTWILTVSIGIYVPIFHWAQHFFDGIHYAAAMFAVLRAGAWAGAAGSPAWRAKAAWTALGCATVLFLPAHVAYRVQAMRDGNSPRPAAVHSALQPKAERDAILWLRSHARRSELVLAPRVHAGWLAAVPMHSFASHFHFSLTYQQQAALSDAFFAGKLNETEAASLLETYGVSYLVIPADSPGLRYLGSRIPTEVLGPLRLYHFPERLMKPYPGLAAARKIRLAGSPAGAALEAKDIDDRERQ
ncbi:MAG: hypothetical protein SGI92_15870 [Bryobacteraceae bacterium]|nr:hypothetical protein [Bryobacteraceae bacterium]